MREIDYNALLVEVTDSVGIVTDANTYELLYMNKAALRTYGLSDEEAYQGKACYKVLQGLEQPCVNCPIKRIAPGQMYRWEQYNQRVGLWLDNSDYLVEGADRSLYIKIARDITARREETISQPQTLTMEDTLFRCLYVISKEAEFHTALQMILESVAKYYQADRAYIFEFDLPKQVLNNTYEWCAEGVSAEIDHLQNIPVDVVKDWVKKFESAGEFSISALDAELDPEAEDYRILAAQGIEGLMAAPFKEGATITGFLGVDNPRRHDGNLLLLRSVTDFICVELEKRRLLQELEYMCYTDALTGIHNRQQYERYLNKYDVRMPQSLGAIFVSINGMKNINEDFGTSYGDTVICKTCGIIQDVVPGQAFRLSGDEFVALCDDIENNAFQEVVSALRKQFRENDNCPVSIGCAWNSGEINVTLLLKQASDIMYAEKRNYYDGVLKKGYRSEHNSSAEAVLSEIRDNRFVAYFQPQIDLESRKICGVETLVRKIGDDGTLIFPDKFIPFYEAAGVIRYVDLHMLEKACMAVKDWEREGYFLRVSVNFSRLTLMEPEIVRELLRICTDNGVSPTSITIEVTENISKIEPAYLEELVKALKEAGFTVSLDDFGSSYSNLAILSAIEFDEIKFDKTLVQNLEMNSKSRVVIRNGIQMCHELEGALSVAEGIETVEQLALLRTYGCHIGQGYYFSRPISRDAFSALMKEKETWFE